jgi:hypothetical protein
MRLWLISLTILFSVAAASAQDTIQLQCRKLSSAGDVLDSDETLINGMACRQVRQSAAPTAPTNSTAPAAWFPASKETGVSSVGTPAAESKRSPVVEVIVNRQCLILKRMGPADQITSHMYSFGIRGKQFQYVEGDFPPGTKFHGRLTDHDVRNIQGHSGRVVIMEPKYNADDLREAKQSCRQPSA